jgi:hypothetical protein
MTVAMPPSEPPRWPLADDSGPPREARRRLRDIELGGWRWTAHMVSMLAIVVAAATVTISYFYGLHALDGVDHSGYSDGGLLPPLFTALVSFGALWSAPSRHLGGGLAVGFGGVIGSLVAIVSVGFAHGVLSDEVETGTATVFYIAALGLLALGIVAVVMHPILFITMRRKLAREQDPIFPTARARFRAGA